MSNLTLSPKKRLLIILGIGLLVLAGLLTAALGMRTSYTTYTDSAKLYSLQYPTSWQQCVVQTGGDGIVRDYSYLSKPVQLLYAGFDCKQDFGRGITVQGDSTEETYYNITKNWSDNDHAPVQLSINGNQAQFVTNTFKGDAESYTDYQYLIKKPGKGTVYISYRQNYNHDNVTPPVKWDDSAQKAAFEKLVYSVQIPAGVE